jgi:hypothetical protein
VAQVDKFYAYTPPPGQAPNMFAAFVSNRLAMRTPLVMKLIDDLLKGADPAARDAYLGQLAQKEADLTEQIARATREAAKIAHEENLSADDTLRAISVAMTNRMSEAAASTRTNADVTGKLAENRHLTDDDRAFVESLIPALRRASDAVQNAEVDGDDNASDLALRGLSNRLAQARKEAEAKAATNPDAGAAINDAIRAAVLDAMPEDSGAAELFREEVEQAFPASASFQIERAGAQSAAAFTQDIVNAYQAALQAGRPPPERTTSTSSETTTTTRTPSGSSPAGAASPSRGTGTTAPSTATGARPAPAADLGTVYDELERTRAERERVLADNPLADRAVLALSLLGGGRSSSRKPGAGPAEGETSPPKKREGDFLDRTTANLVEIMGRVVAPKGKEEDDEYDVDEEDESVQLTGKGKGRKRKRDASAFYAPVSGESSVG